MTVGQAGESAGLLVLVAYRTRQVKCGTISGDGAVGLTGGEENLAQAVQRLSLAATVTGFAAELQSMPEPGSGLFVPSLPQVDESEADQAAGGQGEVARVTVDGLFLRMRSPACS